MRMKLRELRQRLGQVQTRFGDRLLTWLTILLGVFTFVIVPLHASGLIVLQGYSFAIVLVMVSCIVAVPAGFGAVIVMLFGVALAIAAVVARHMGHPRSGMHLDAAAWVTVGAALAYVVARAVFAPGRVTYHRINGAVLLYLTIGQIFVGLYGVVDLLAPNALNGLNLAEGPKLVSDLIYSVFRRLPRSAMAILCRCIRSHAALAVLRQSSASFTLLLCSRGLSPWSLKTAARRCSV